MDAELLNIGPKMSSVPSVRLIEEAPSARASPEERAAWSERYVSWFIAQTPEVGTLPAEVSPTHRYQVEFSSCVLDPRAYERMTKSALSHVSDPN